MNKDILSKEIDNEKVKKVVLYLLAFFIPFMILIISKINIHFIKQIIT